MNEAVSSSVFLLPCALIPLHFLWLLLNGAHSLGRMLKEQRQGPGQRWVVRILVPGRGQLDGGRLARSQRDEGNAVRVQRRGRLGDKREADPSLHEGEHRVHL